MPGPAPYLEPSPGLLPGGATPFTDQLQASLATLADPAGHWYAYNAALGAMFEQVSGLVADFGDPDDPANYTPGWSTLLDPDNCPTQFLPYAGQFVGVPIQPGTDDATGRSLLRNEQGFQRGTPASIIAAAQRFLTGSQSVALLERTPNPYSFQLVVRPEQVLDLNGLVNAVTAVKPAGVTFAVVQSTNYIFNQAAHAFSADTMTWAATASTQP